MMGLLERDGYTIVSDPALADLVIINSCTVKDRTYLDLKKRVGALTSTTSTSPHVVLAGCAPRVPQQSAHFANVSQVGPDNLAAVPEVVRRTLQGEVVHQLARDHDADRLLLPSRRRNPLVEIVPISKGCLGSCTFCQTVLARGRLRSFPEQQILQRIEKAVSEGVEQVWLTSQDCGAYGLDCGTNLARLLRRVRRIPGDFCVRVGMANPDMIKLFLDEFVEALDHERFFQFAHIPVQSGSNLVLDAMKRLYSTDDFRRICDALRERMPAITLATDIIVGFPTERDEDFAETQQLLREVAIPIVNRSRFSPRAGTSAARLRGLPGKIVATRSKQLLETCREISKQSLSVYVDRVLQVTVEERVSTTHVMGRTPEYVPVILEYPNSAQAKIAVRVSHVEGFHLAGTLELPG